MREIASQLRAWLAGGTSFAVAIETGEPVALATVIGGTPERLGAQLVVTGEGSGGSLGDDRARPLRAAVAEDARGLLNRTLTRRADRGYSRH